MCVYVMLCMCASFSALNIGVMPQDIYGKSKVILYMCHMTFQVNINALGVKLFHRPIYSRNQYYKKEQGNCTNR